MNFIAWQLTSVLLFFNRNLQTFDVFIIRVNVQLKPEIIYFLSGIERHVSYSLNSTNTLQYSQMIFKLQRSLRKSHDEVPGSPWPLLARLRGRRVLAPQPPLPGGGVAGVGARPRTREQRVQRPRVGQHPRQHRAQLRAEPRRLGLGAGRAHPGKISKE